MFAFGCRGVVAALRSASDPSTFSATRRDARPAARAQRRCSGAGRSHNGQLERCATLVSTCTAARSATTTCARPPTQFKARALGSRCRCTERARSMASPQPAQRCSPDRSASWPVMSGGGGASARAVIGTKVEIAYKPPERKKSGKLVAPGNVTVAITDPSGQRTTTLVSELL